MAKEKNNFFNVDASENDFGFNSTLFTKPDIAVIGVVIK